MSEIANLLRSLILFAAVLLLGYLWLYRNRRNDSTPQTSTVATDNNLAAATEDPYPMRKPIGRMAGSFRHAAQHPELELLLLSNGDSCVICNIASIARRGSNIESYRVNHAFQNGAIGTLNGTEVVCYQDTTEKIVVKTIHDVDAIVAECDCEAHAEKLMVAGGYVIGLFSSHDLMVYAVNEGALMSRRTFKGVKSFDVCGHALAVLSLDGLALQVNLSDGSKISEQAHCDSIFLCGRHLVTSLQGCIGFRRGVIARGEWKMISRGGEQIVAVNDTQVDILSAEGERIDRFKVEQRPRDVVLSNGGRLLCALTASECFFYQVRTLKSGTTSDEVGNDEQ